MEDLCSSAVSARFGRLLFFLLLLSASTNAQQRALPKHPFPAFFIFGDSLVDVGNNNYILSLAKSNSPPFGIDFPAGPTGRFTNGKTVVDVITELIDLPLVPPYLAPTTRGKALLQGVNYASGAGGIVPRSGFNYIGRIDFDTQLEWFGNTISELQNLIGVPAAQDLVAKSLYSTVLGSNDYINNYLLSFSPTSKQYTPQQYQDLLLNKFSSQLTQLYNMGPRSIAVSNIGPIGCIPSQLAQQKSVNGECSEFVNNLARNFNAGLEVLIKQLNAELPGAKFIYADTFGPVLSYRNNPSAYGFTNGVIACCGLGKYKGQIPCLRFVKPCPNRDVYVFWDPYHPTEAANILLGNSLYRGLSSNFLNNP